MRIRHAVSLAAIAMVSAYAMSAAAQPAFPGAEGFGASATGGRGGPVLRVTTLASSGPGSLQEALDTPGALFIVFTVSGVIQGDVVIPHGALHAIPFHALSDADRPVIETLDVTYAPSASVLRRMLSRPATAAGVGHTLVVGVSDELIPHAEREAREIAGKVENARLRKSSGCSSAQDL